MEEQFEDSMSRFGAGASGPQLCGPCGHTMHGKTCGKPLVMDDTTRCECEKAIRTDAYLNYQMGILIHRQTIVARQLARLLELTGVATNLQIIENEDKTFTVVPRSNLVPPDSGLVGVNGGKL